MSLSTVSNLMLKVLRKASYHLMLASFDQAIASRLAISFCSLQSGSRVLCPSQIVDCQQRCMVKPNSLIKCSPKTAIQMPLFKWSSAIWPLLAPLSSLAAFSVTELQPTKFWLRKELPNRMWNSRVLWSSLMSVSKLGNVLLKNCTKCQIWENETLTLLKTDTG